MRRPERLLVSLTILFASSAFSQGLPKPLPAPASQDEKMKWFREAKFGLFIHWGLYAIPAGEWKGQPIAGIGEWIMNRAKIPVKEYEQLATQFNPVKFNAEAWVQDGRGRRHEVHRDHQQASRRLRDVPLARSASTTSTTPRRSSAIRSRNSPPPARATTSSSASTTRRRRTGTSPTAPATPGTSARTTRRTYDQYLRGKAEPQVKELLTNYGPICLIWFDTPRMMTGERGAAFHRHRARRCSPPR